jgi:Right handed beta helix region
MSGSLYPERMPPAHRRSPQSLPYRRAIIVLGSLVAVITGLFVLGTGGKRTLEVGTDKELEKALERVTGGETIMLKPGRYGFHYLRKPYASPVTVRGVDRGSVQVQGFSTAADADARTAAGNVVIRDMTISGPDGSRDAIRINRGAHHIVLEDLTIRGGQHCVNINAYPYAGVTWPHDITVRNSDLSDSLGDVVQITGGRNLVFEHNFIHDPQDNPDDHVDGIQVIASDDVKIVGNSFTEPPSGTADVNQAIILGRADPYDRALTVRRSYVANNLIAGWRGSGILLAGTEITWVVNNTSMPYRGHSGFVTVDKDPSASGGTAEAWYNADLKVWNNIFNKVSTDSRSEPVFAAHNLITTRRTGFGENLLTGRARFVTTDPTRPERYKLKAVSPAVDSGMTTPDGMTPSTDLDGLSRWGLPDRGAREYRPPADRPMGQPDDAAAPRVNRSNTAT